MDCRKNQANLTAAEKAAFVNAVLALKNNVPSQLHTGNSTRHRYDDYVETHMNAMMLMDGTSRIPGWAHQGSAFLPWHREFIRRFELDLQAIDPTVTLPYWDWTVDNSPDPISGSPWTDDFMGKLDPNTDQVTSGPFKAGSWILVVAENGDTDLRRALGRAQFQDPNSIATSLPTIIQVNDTLTVTPYDNPNWDINAKPSFRNRLEGWYGKGSIHNRVHLWVSGSMYFSTSPNDPIFFLHHCNIDRLWQMWQQQHPTEGYHPTGVGSEMGPLGHNLNDVMIFNDPGQPAPWTVTATPASVLDHHVLGYCYDTNPPELKLIKPSIDLGAVPEGVRSITGISSSDLSSSIPVNQPLNKSKMVSREAVLQEDDTRHPKPRFSLSPEDKASGEQVLSKDDTRRLRPRYGLSPEDKTSNEHK